jgi:hypothetical protein
MAGSEVGKNQRHSTTFLNASFAAARFKYLLLPQSAALRFPIPVLIVQALAGAWGVCVPLQQ